MHRKRDILLNFIESPTFLWGIFWENSFVTILENPGVEWKFLFCYFSDFLSCLQLGWQKWPFFREFCGKNQILEFQKRDVLEKWKFSPGIETKDFQGVKSVRKEVFLDSTRNRWTPKSVDGAEISKNCFLRQPSS